MMQLLQLDEARVEHNGKWIPALPMEEQKPYKPFMWRVRDAIAVFKCEAVAVKWPSPPKEGAK